MTVKRGVAPEWLSTAVVGPDDLGPKSLQEMTLKQRGRVLWQNRCSTFISGA